MIIIAERINSDFIIYLTLIFIIFFGITFIKIGTLYVTVRVRFRRVAWWYGCPSVHNSPRHFIR